MYKEVKLNGTDHYECASNCPLFEETDLGKKCVNNCSKGYDYVDDGKCVKSCPYGYSTVNTWPGTNLSTCISNISECKYIQNQTDGDSAVIVCYDSCPPGTIQSVQSGSEKFWCTDNCPDN